MLEGQPLSQDVILITGGGSGLGKSMAQTLAQLGAKITILGRRQSVLEEAAQEITNATNRPSEDILPLPCDVRDFPAVEKAVETTAQTFGKITGLINNAAGNFLAQTEKLSPNGFKTIVDIVLNGTFHATLAAGRKMIQQNTGGNILNITTTYAWMGSAFVVPSACAKAGVLAMTRSLAVEWAEYKIRINAVAPGPFPTPGAWEKLMPEGMEDFAKTKIPLKRFGKHHELANLCAYLMSPYSAYITGACIPIDGGEWLMGGEFNHLTLTLNPEQRSQIFEMMRERQKSKKNHPKQNPPQKNNP
ncbi:MAG: SDR family oxidoreductase [Planctomycetota bacterium]|nr:MAG: SDR family oxidoreductase [Planctomycetota bacterium]